MAFNNKQFDSRQLVDKEIAFIDGTVEFSSITRQRSVEEINKTRVGNGLNPVTRPQAEITIKNAQVVPLDASNPSFLENYLHERLYVPKKNPDGILRYSAANSGRTLPIVAVRQSDGTYQQTTLDGEPAQGTHVRIVIRSYNTGSKSGTTLDQVLFAEEPQTVGANGGVTVANLEAYGITYSTPPVPQSASDVAVPAENTEMQGGLAFPAPAAPSQQNASQHFGQQQQAPQAQAQPAFGAPSFPAPQQQAPQQAPQQVQPSSDYVAPTNSPFGSPQQTLNDSQGQQAGQQSPSSDTDPWSGIQGQNQPGITFG